MLKVPYKILIVDDDQDVADILKDLIVDLYEELFDITAINSSEAALQLLKGHNFDIFITDLTMPGIIGEQLIVEALDMKKGIQVIVSSGTTSYVLVNNCYLDGATYFLRKPFSIDRVQEGLDICLQKMKFWEKFLKEAHSGK